MEWKPKYVNVGLMAQTSLRASSRDDWYLDSGCSKHMIGVNKFLDTVKNYTDSHVTFGDGAEGKILGIGNLIHDESLRLNNVLLVKELTTNLISISQLCDQGLNVNFDDMLSLRNF